MRWFVITNRNKREDGSFGNDPENYGMVHFLSKETNGFPQRDKDLGVDYMGNSSSGPDIQKFVNEIRKELIERQKKLDEKNIDRKPSLLIYTHGYNNDYRDALEEYSELRRNFNDVIDKTGYDADFEEQCLTMLFTWPSEGKTLKYLEDRDDARSSYLAVSNLVHILFAVTNQLESCISNICLLGHSMGNYVIREAFSVLVGSARSPAGTFINQFIMFAADVGNTSLEPGGKGWGIVRFSDRVSVYYSGHDSTLAKSKRKNGRPRLGRTLSSGYSSTPDNVNFIDCKEWANKDVLKTLFSDKKAPSIHSCYRSVPAILKDMYETLCEVDGELVSNRTSMDMNKLYVINK